jgi:tetratricopeptide (TPR) repeat protein
MSPELQRALLLYEQSRYEQAQTELRRLLASEPNDAFAHALLGLCLAKNKQLNEALQESQHAIHLAPDEAFHHYAMASVLVEREDFDDAGFAIAESLRLDPHQADAFSLQAAVRLQQRDWKGALASADKGLEIDAEHVGCTNLRAMALRQLNRKEEAAATMHEALAKAPEDAPTHANQGWALLQRGDPTKALEHFREALRIDPELDWAREGIVEALKARNPIYRLVLAYFFWMSRLSTGAQWGVLIGGVIGNRLLNALAKSSPGLAPFIFPVQVLYLIFVLLTWTAKPMFNLVLRLNRFGRMALSEEQVKASNWMGLVLLIALLGLASGLFLNVPQGLMVALVFGGMLVPLGATFQCQLKKPRRRLALLTAVLGALGFAALALRLIGSEAAAAAGVVFFFGLVASMWLANVILTRR